MDYIIIKNEKRWLFILLSIMIIIGFCLLFIGNKDEDISIGCFLIITGVVLYYLSSYFIWKPKCYQTINSNNINEFTL